MLCSHVADVVCHHVGGCPSFNEENTEGTEPLQCSVPCVWVSIRWVLPEVQSQQVRRAMCLQSLSEVQQLSRLNEVGTFQDQRQQMEIIV